MTESPMEEYRRLVKQCVAAKANDGGALEDAHAALRNWRERNPKSYVEPEPPIRCVNPYWKNAKEIEKKYWHQPKKEIMNHSHNCPEDIVEDIMGKDGIFKPNFQRHLIRDFLYSVLLRHGVNKWFFVRKLLFRYIKHMKAVSEYHGRKAEEERDLADFYRNNARMAATERIKNKYHSTANHCWGKYHYHRGVLRAYEGVRCDLKTLCDGPMWVIWNFRVPALFDLTGMKQGKQERFIDLYDVLQSSKFRK